MSASDRLVATSSQTVGPFFAVGPCPDAHLGRMATAEVPGEHIVLRVRVLDGDGVPVKDAMVELWQADASGAYSVAGATMGEAPAFSGFGRLGTDAEGWCAFDTVRPGRVGAGTEAAQAPHVNVCVFARGLLRHLYTRIYFDGDAGLDRDPLLALVHDDRRGTLLARRGSQGTWDFVVRLQGEDETVFFEL